MADAMTPFKLAALFEHNFCSQLLRKLFSCKMLFIMPTVAYNLRTKSKNFLLVVYYLFDLFVLLLRSPLYLSLSIYVL